ncbi:MAG: hypothetical protein QOI91_1395 [Solirubrobacteraceae bacterium]|nr:hypothetical protein [Solirubrobacteraceae bacterium]
MAGRQHGVVSRSQLLALGLGADAIDHRLAAGRLHPLHRGIYAVGHRVVSREGRWMAAVLAAGPGAVLSHRAAGALWDLRPTARAQVEVTAPRALRSRGALQMHRTELAQDERTTHRGIPVTTPARTLLDLAAVLPGPALGRAAEQAEALHLVDWASLDESLKRHPRRPGAPRLRAILDSGRVGIVTRSELEARFLALVTAAGLPAPRMNARIAVGGRRLEVDCVWPESRVAVELDGHAYHSTRAAFERDRARDRLLQAAGWRVIRITWRQLHDEPQAVLGDLKRLIQRRECS